MGGASRLAQGVKMRLSEMFEEAWAVLPLTSRNLADALEEILARAAAAGAMEREEALAMARALSSGAQGELARIHEDVVAVLGSVDKQERLSWTVGIAPRPIRVAVQGWAEHGEARGIILALAPRRRAVLRQDLLPIFARALRDGDTAARFLAAGSPGDILQIPGLAGAEFHPRLRVEDALVAVPWRVHPDAPVDDVVRLMVHRKIHAVPVVGPGDEVLGILTVGDALAYRLEGSAPGAEHPSRSGSEPRRVRDVMTRTVLCVSEDQPLAEAAHTLVNRDVEQLPVVREGGLVGLVTRDSILQALYGSTFPPEPEPRQGPREP